MVQSWGNIFKKFSKFRKISCSSKSISKYLRKVENKEINNQKDINKQLYLYYQNLFYERQNLSEYDIKNFLSAVSNFAQLYTEQPLQCEKDIKEK